MQDTLTRLLDNRAGQNVNSIPGYSALWIDALMQYYLHTGSLDYLKSVHQQLLDLLAVMDSEMDADHLFADTSKQWPSSTGVPTSPPTRRRRAAARSSRTSSRSMTPPTCCASWATTQPPPSATRPPRSSLPRRRAICWIRPAAHSAAAGRLTAWPSSPAQPRRPRYPRSGHGAHAHRGRQLPRAPHYAVLQLLRHLRNGRYRAPRGGPRMDSQVLGRHDRRRRNQLLGGLRHALAHAESTCLATGRRKHWILRLAGAWMVVRPHRVADGGDSRRTDPQAPASAPRRCAPISRAWPGRAAPCRHPTAPSPSTSNPRRPQSPFRPASNSPCWSPSRRDTAPSCSMGRRCSPAHSAKTARAPRSCSPNPALTPWKRNKIVKADCSVARRTRATRAVSSAWNRGENE